MNTLDTVVISLPALQRWQDTCKRFVMSPDTNPAIVRALVHAMEDARINCDGTLTVYVAVNGQEVLSMDIPAAEWCHAN